MARLMFFQVRDVIKYCFFLLLFFSLPGKAQYVPDTLTVHLPHTSLNTENTLFFIENRAEVYFSYNPDIFKNDLTVEWAAGDYLLKDILDTLCRLQEVQYTFIGNQVVFYTEGQDPYLPSPGTKKSIQQPVKRIRGRILGISDGEPLAYATVWQPSTWDGTIANSDGQFEMKLVPGINADTLAFSCMGYTSKRIPVSDLNDSVNTIYLKESVIPIQEVVIRRTDPLHLLHLALLKIPENYSGEPVVETAFYRETIQKDNRYIAVSEAVVEIYKPGFSSYSSEQVRVLRGKKNHDFSDTDTLMVKLKGGLETSFLLDFIRNRPDFLQEEHFPEFNYRMSDIVVIEDKSTYAIDFKQNETTEPPHYKGSIYIDLESLALRTLSSVANSMVYKKPRRVKVKPLSAAYDIRYKSDGGLYNLSMIRTENLFRIRPRKKMSGNQYRSVSEMAVTGLKTEEVNRFRVREIANPGDVFIDMLGGYDPDFWGPYNYIIPEESLEEALIRISRLMKAPASD